MALPATPVVIQGRVVGSKEELWVAEALTHYGWIFQYQVPFRGGWISGGFVVDFVVITVPLPTPLWINGEYWHRGAQAERDKLRQALFQGSIRGYMPSKTWWGEDLPTPDAARRMVLREFGRL